MNHLVDSDQFCTGHFDVFCLLIIIAVAGDHNVAYLNPVKNLTCGQPLGASLAAGKKWVQAGFKLVGAFDIV